MTSRSDRTWPVPKQPWGMRMTWSQLLFAHWPVDPSIVASLLPAGLQLDTFGGKAWMGLVPFLMSDLAPRCCPAVPRLSRFLELNVRTYVTHEDKPGVWFFSLDAANRIAVRAAGHSFICPTWTQRCRCIATIQLDHLSQSAYTSRRTSGRFGHQLPCSRPCIARTTGYLGTLANGSILSLQR